MDDQMSLTDLFDHYMSDKGNFGEGHLYSPEYEVLIPRSTESILEIGIGTHLNFNGSFGSIRAWLDWLKGGTVYGFDILPPPQELLDRDKFVFIQGDQGKREDIDKLAERVGVTDVIIDDGSHDSEHQLLCLERLWPILVRGGAYVIEDVHLTYGKSTRLINMLSEDYRFERFIGRDNHGMLFRKPFE